MKVKESKSSSSDGINTTAPMYPGYTRPYVGDPPPGLQPWVGDPPPGTPTGTWPAPKVVEAKQLQGTVDRVSYSLSRKVNIGNYESIEIHESFSTDIQPGETQEAALARAAGFVERTVAARVKMLREEFGLG